MDSMDVEVGVECWRWSWVWLMMMIQLCHQSFCFYLLR